MHTSSSLSTTAPMRPGKRATTSSLTGRPKNTRPYLVTNTALKKVWQATLLQPIKRPVTTTMTMTTTVITIQSIGLIRVQSQESKTKELAPPAGRSPPLAPSRVPIMLPLKSCFRFQSSSWSTALLWCTETSDAMAADKSMPIPTFSITTLPFLDLTTLTRQPMATRAPVFTNSFLNQLSLCLITRQ